MQRRQFLKSTAAIFSAALVPSIVRPRVDLAAWCDVEICRYDLSKPFQQGEHVFATDARACVRVAGSVFNIDDSDRTLPNANGLFWDVFNDSHLPWSDFQNVERRAKPGNSVETYCPNCYRGEGRRKATPADYRSPHYDPDDNTVWVGCDLCNDDNNPYRGVSVADDILVSTYYGRQLEALNAEVVDVSKSRVAAVQQYFDSRSWFDNRPNPCIAFRGDGIQGLVMGLARELES